MEPLFPQLGFLPGERELRMTGRPAAEVLQMLNPIPGIMNAMQQAGRAADPNLSPEERRAALGESAMETGIAALPVAGGALGRMVLRNAPAATRTAVSEAGDVMETLTAARPDVPVVNDNIIDPQDIDFNDATAFNQQFTAARNQQAFEQQPFVEEEFPAPVAPAMDPVDQNIMNALEEDVWDNGVDWPELPVAEQTGMLSTIGRAALNLEQPRYGSYDEVIANLRRLGARQTELRTSGIGSLQDVEGPITQDMIREAVEGDNPLEVIRFSEAGTVHGERFTPGGENYREVVVRSPNALMSSDQGDFSNLIQPDPFHLPDAGTNQVVHYRAATFPVEGGETYHVGEIQSDWAKQIRDVREELRIFNLTPEEAATEYRANVDQATDIDAKHEELLERGRQLDEDYSSGLLRAEDLGQGHQEIARELGDLRDEARTLREGRERLSMYWTESQQGDPIKLDVEEPVVPEAPIVSNTNDYTQLAIRQALLDAANSPQNYLTFGTGDMAADMTFGRRSGQRKYYDEIVPRQLRETLRRLSREYDIEMPEIEQVQMYSNDRADSYTVPGIRLTPELRQAIADYGMPMFKEGGMVNLKSGLASMANEVL